MEKDELQALEMLLSANDQYVIARQPPGGEDSYIQCEHRKTATTLHFVHG